MKDDFNYGGPMATGPGHCGLQLHSGWEDGLNPLRDGWNCSTPDTNLCDLIWKESLRRNNHTTGEPLEWL